MKTLSSIAIAALCVSLARPVSAACPSMVFTTQQTLADTSPRHYDLQTVDYDDDGKLDVIGLRVEPNGGGTLMAWRGVGDGTFQTAVTLGTADVFHMVAADVNNDGRLDLIMTVSSQLYVRLGNGSGFGAAIVQSLSLSPTRLAAVSLDGDGFVDLVISSTSGDKVRTYHGEGNGNFTQVAELTTARFPFAVTAADFDADGRVDIAYSRLETNLVQIAFKNPDGSYAAPISLQSSAVPIPPYVNYANDVAVADVDEDGRPDLVTSNWEAAPQPEKEAVVAILRNEGSRTFSRSVLVPGIRNTSGNFMSLQVRDIDGDGHVDIVTSSVNGGLIAVFAGQGDGTFYSPTLYKPTGVEEQYSSFATGDFDGDGDTDLAVGGWENFIAATSACGTQVTLFSDSPIITQGQTAPLRARIAGIGSATPLPRGTVTFREGATVLGVVGVDVKGYCSLDVSGLPLGDHTLTADFSGNAVLSAASSPSIVQKVTTESTQTVIVFPGSPPVYGTPYSFNVVIYNPFNSPMNHFYTLDVDGVTSQRWNGQSVTMNFLPGPHTITASYIGDAFYPPYPPSTSGPQIITAVKATPSMANTGGALSVRLGEAHTLQFTMTGPNGFAGPTGTVQLKRGTTILGAGNVSNGGGTLSIGTTSLSATLERGTHALTAVYSGDGNFNGATVNLTLSVLPNLPLAIDARGLQSAVSIRAVLPPNTTSTTLLRSPAGTGAWAVVPGWTPQSEYDTNVVAGVLYDYWLSAVVSGAEQTSNIDSALVFADEPVVPTITIIKRRHFDELRLVVNALRSNAGLPPFNFDASYAGQIVMASHLASLRTALTEARQSLGMLSATYTDSAVPGTVIKAVHIQELREQAR